jgi:two-component system, OmpR family, response regulator PfeR
MNRAFPRVLVIDDAETENHYLCKIFEMWKWDYRSALTCARALNLLKSAEIFDLVILDLILPDCDGIGVLQWIREHDYRAKVIVITGKPLEECGDVGALKPDHLAIKPFSFEPVRKMGQEIFDQFFEERAAKLAESMPETAKARSK